ncbi:HAD family hydrolase [Streptomyces sp. GS7]|uniref:HAD family hydrolase n=1 Tax=Streptomyces sp. GS7 TaxID=2692234 RepID=UPI0013194A74|nr:HAD-IA family hydrolase [Streptomyces sp. GS7]QHC25262.1 HAD-IA family hydrolase [Streptomyces sp. GS7]
MDSDELSKTLAGASAVLFDFDGPLCDVFAGMPAPKVAGELARKASAHDAALRAKLAATDDPIEVLRLAFDADPEIGSEVDQALTAAEVEAVAVAGAPTAGAVAALEAVKAAGRRIAVVSNNSAECVRSFLARHLLDEHVREVIGRPVNRPDLMKPHPHSLLRAAELLEVSPSECVLIGDSITDIQAAHLAGGTAIGYANKPHKRDAFVEAGAEAVTEYMKAIADAMR